MRPPRWLRRLARRLAAPPLAGRVLEVNDLATLKLALGWSRDPVLTGEHLRAYEFPEDLNQRRLRDAEALGAACANQAGGILLEIGTAEGRSTALMAENAPTSTIHTVNIPPEEIAAGGTLTTRAFPRDDIGRHWRERGCTNVRQILANTASWHPDFGPIDLAFIDGCHDADFVDSDTRLVLERSRPGTLILWHDFHPGLVHRFPWLGNVCEGIERLYDGGVLSGPIWHLRDSWTGIYRVPNRS